MCHQREAVQYRVSCAMAWPSATLFKCVLVCCLIRAASEHIYSIGRWSCAPPKEWAATERVTGEARFDLNVTDTKYRNVKLLFGSVHFIDGPEWNNSSTYAVVGTLDVYAMFLSIGTWDSLTTDRLADIMSLSGDKFDGEAHYLRARSRICRGGTMVREAGVFDVPSFSGVISYITDIPFDKMQAKLNVTSNPSFCDANRIHLEQVGEPVKYNVLFTLVYVLQFVVLVRQILALDTQEKALAIPIFSVALLFGYILSLAVYYSRHSGATATATFGCACACVAWIIRLLNARRYPTRRNAVLEAVFMVATLLVMFAVFYFIVRFLFRVDYYLVAVVELSFFVPQIVKNQTEGQWGALHPSFIVVTALAALTLPFYLFARSRPFLVAFIMAYVGAQAGYLLWGGISKLRRTAQYSAIVADE